MDTEYVEVKFPDGRTVYIDEKDSGPTNKILRVNTGAHEFDLGTPKNYRPEKISSVIKDTNELEPAVIEFEKVSA